MPRPKTSSVPSALVNPARRQACAWPLALGLGALCPLARAGYATAPPPPPPAVAAPAAATTASAASAASAATPTRPPADGRRLALLVGNQVYPPPFDLPPVHKNLRDLAAALDGRGFEVSTAADLPLAAAREAVERFGRTVAAAPADAVVFFYFTGHGLQLRSENLLVAAGTSPSAPPDALSGGSLVLLADVLARLPRRPQGLTVAVIDACRTTLKAALEASDGLNQVEAPPGCMIVFSTAAGRPAIAPSVADQNTFYTASLVKLLQQASDEISFSDLFRLVKLDVQQTMLNHPLEPIRRLAQFPFIAENTQGRVLLAQRPAAAPAAPAAAAPAADEADDWQRLQDSLWPADVARRADEYLRRHPASLRSGSARVMLEGAREAAAILRRSDLRLYRRAFERDAALGDAYLEDLYRAGRGDKDAAARIGRRWRTEAQAGPELSRYEGWMQYAAELGNGIASYELALHYRRLDQPQPAARWEARARELGYTPPPTLDNVRK